MQFNLPCFILFLMCIEASKKTKQTTDRNSLPSKERDGFGSLAVARGRGRGRGDWSVGTPGGMQEITYTVPADKCGLVIGKGRSGGSKYSSFHFFILGMVTFLLPDSFLWVQVFSGQWMQRGSKLEALFVVYFVVFSIIIVLSRPLFTICKRGSSCGAVRQACYNKQLAEKRQFHLQILF